MDRKDVYAAIDGERDYQDKMSASADRPDMRPELSMGECLLAMKRTLDQAIEQWYPGAPPYADAMAFVRKTTALGVMAMEKYGVNPR